MPTTTVLHVSQADIDYILFIRSVEPWDDMQAIAEFAVYKADACSRVQLGRTSAANVVSGQNDPSIELVTP